MMLTWNKREGDRLTLGSYHDAGLPGQIARAVEIAGPSRCAASWSLVRAR
jgi:hypothetical protein